MLAFAVIDDARENHQLGVFRQCHDGIDHFGDGLRDHRQVVFRAHGRADTGVQQTQIVINLGNRTHRGAGVMVGGFLLDGDGR